MSFVHSQKYHPSRLQRVYLQISYYYNFIQTVTYNHTRGAYVVRSDAFGLSFRIILLLSFDIYRISSYRFDIDIGAVLVS